MKTSPFFLGLALALSLASVTVPAGAHFKLHRPVDRLKALSDGTPEEGTQKENPCGKGSLSGLHTRVRAGAKLHIRLTETVAHGGHYRIAMLPKLNPTDTELPEPETTVVADECKSAKVQSPVVAPVIADGLFDHTQAAATDDKIWETDITVPDQVGDATLQIIEFMTPHSPGCYYHHCAQLEIVASSRTDVPDQGVILGPDGGVVDLPANADDIPSLSIPAPSDPGTSSSGATGTSGTPGGADPGGGTTGTSSGRSPGGSSSSDGCNVGSDGGVPSLAAAAALAALGLSAARRRRQS